MPTFSVREGSPSTATGVTSDPVPAVVGTGAIAHPAVINFVGDFGLIAGKSLSFGGVEAMRPSRHEALGRIIQIFDDFGTGTAFVAKLRHRVGDQEVGS